MRCSSSQLLARERDNGGKVGLSQSVYNLDARLRERGRVWRGREGVAWEGVAWEDAA